MTFQDLVRERPELLRIKSDAFQWYKQPYRWHVYEALKKKMQQCVGWYAVEGMPEYMYTETAYDVAHKEIFR